MAASRGISALVGQGLLPRAALSSLSRAGFVGERSFGGLLSTASAGTAAQPSVPGLSQASQPAQSIGAMNYQTSSANISAAGAALGRQACRIPESLARGFACSQQILMAQSQEGKRDGLLAFGCVRLQAEAMGDNRPQSSQRAHACGHAQCKTWSHVCKPHSLRGLRAPCLPASTADDDGI